MVQSVGSQGWGLMTGQDAYAYGLGSAWDDYNVEQQASIVEDWFAYGMNVSDPFYPFIQDTIQARPYWISK